MKEVIVEADNYPEALRKIRKNKLNEQTKTIKLEKKCQNKKEQHLLEQVVKAYNIKDLKKRYSFIYDEVCNQLDNEFKKSNTCAFENNRCIAVRTGNYCNSVNGCCYHKTRGKCKFLKEDRCSIQSISCKLFTCRYLKKNKKKILIKDIPLLDIFFNYSQKYIIIYSIFVDKKEVISRLLKYTK